MGVREPKSPFLALGSEWGKQQEWNGEPRRELGSEATCAIIAPSAQQARLAFTAIGIAGARSLELSLNGELAGIYDITPQAEQFVTASLSLHEGLNVL